jgi:hypothetical protein
MQIGEFNAIQNLLRPLFYGICAGIFSVFFVVALAFLTAFGNPTVLAKNVLAYADIFLRFYGDLWIIGAVWVLAILLSQKRRTIQ